MTITYCRNDPVSARWTGVNRLLTEYEVDFNFFQHNSRIATLEGNYTLTVSIGSISQPTPSTLLLTMTDSSTRGPFSLPVAAFTDRGTWAATVVYFVNDTFSINGTLYRVLFQHIAQSTFSAAANDGAGHNYYAAMITTAGSALPTGGATGQVLQKSTGANYAVTWGNKLPTGGSLGQVLFKQSATNQDADWTTLSAGYVSFAPSTASGLVSRNVSDAIEEVEAELLTLAATGKPLSGLTDVHFGTGDPVTGSLLYFGGTKWTASSTPSTGDIPKWNGSAWAPSTPVDALTDCIEFVIDGGGSAITTGLKGTIEVPYGCTITAARMFADVSGSIVVDLWKCTYSQYDAGSTHPVTGDKITASAPPTISSAVKSSTTLTGWTTSLSAGDLLSYNVNSASTITRVTISLAVTRT